MSRINVHDRIVRLSGRALHSTRRCVARRCAFRLPKTRGARRELRPKGTSDRPTGRTWPEGKPRALCPRASLQAGRPKHDPLVVGRLKAGEATGPRYGQGGYTELESVPLGSASPTRWEGRVAEGKSCLVAIPLVLRQSFPRMISELGRLTLPIGLEGLDENVSQGRYVSDVFISYKQTERVV